MGRTQPSEAEKQEAAEQGEVARVVIESVGGRQRQPHTVTPLQLQHHTGRKRGVAAVGIQPQTEHHWLLIPVQVHTCVALQVVSSCEAEEVEARQWSREHTWTQGWREWRGRKREKNREGEGGAMEKRWRD